MRLDPHDNTAQDYRRARILRNNASPIENRLWIVLREGAKTAGLKFRRQQPIHPYIADFACMAARLLIELDGDSHAETAAYDHARDAKLGTMGFRILRFSNNDVMQNTEGVVTDIITQAVRLINSNIQPVLNTPLPNPPREGEGTAPLLLEDLFSSSMVEGQTRRNNGGIPSPSRGGLGRGERSTAVSPDEANKISPPTKSAQKC